MKRALTLALAIVAQLASVATPSMASHWPTDVQCLGYEMDFNNTTILSVTSDGIGLRGVRTRNPRDSAIVVEYTTEPIQAHFKDCDEATTFVLALAFEGWRLWKEEVMRLDAAQ
jgi:hypothetical protein